MEIMNEQILTVESAKHLIEFIFNTNYKIAPNGDGIFATKEEALQFVESNEYKPDQPLSVVWDTYQGNYCDSVVVTFDSENQLWEMEDHQMGGVYANGTTIVEALGNIRAKYQPTEDFCPIELIINGGGE